ncbi:hypothetical protein L1889_05240 [Paenalcaligenes niemegkensis]|uniref:SecDF P1 head subdomain-containing protein n=1 Tax=Paenalcaligenes niemegkensis TaxID=2895469 RepID=UPI001EE944C9|nr:hypothetical protein [Paenalcaligenes niemegkensis]MCQ9616177.1 hypothetical protein [Paenalcaligenes niemegkensis]
MHSKRWISRIFAPIGLVALAACQTVPQDSDSAAQSAATAPAQTETAATPATGQTAPAEQVAPVLIFLADTEPQTDWVEVDIEPDGKLYVQPEAFLGIEDLTGVEAGRSEAGDGLLALDLNEQAAGTLTRVTSQNINKRLALVVNGTMLAVPGFSEPISGGRLVFMVGSEENALTAARIIAGEDATPRGPNTAPDAAPNAPQPPSIPAQ